MYDVDSLQPTANQCFFFFINPIQTGGLKAFEARSSFEVVYF